MSSIQIALHGAQRQRHVAALVVRAVGADRLRAGAERRHRDRHRHGEGHVLAVRRGVEFHLVIDQPLRLRHRRFLLHEVGKFHLDVRDLRVQLFLQARAAWSADFRRGRAARAR